MIGSAARLTSRSSGGRDQREERESQQSFKGFGHAPPDNASAIRKGRLPDSVQDESLKKQKRDPVADNYSFDESQQRQSEQHSTAERARAAPGAAGVDILGALTKKASNSSTVMSKAEPRASSPSGAGQPDEQPQPDKPCTCPPNVKGQATQEQQPTGKEEEFIQELSHKALVKFISANHPVHPLTKERFQMTDRVTVSSYHLKLCDACGCQRAGSACWRCCRAYTRFALRGGLAGRRAEKKVKPESSRPAGEDSTSESSEFEDEAGFGGLAAAGAHIGIGAGLYLQMMRTFALLFFLLTILNIPVYMMYAGATLHNDYFDLGRGFSFFAVGNVAQTNKVCSAQVVLPITSTSGPKFKLKCTEPHQYLLRLENYGLLYALNPATRKAASATEECKAIMSPSRTLLPRSSRRRVLHSDVTSELNFE